MPVLEADGLDAVVEGLYVDELVLDVYPDVPRDGLADDTEVRDAVPDVRDATDEDLEIPDDVLLTRLSPEDDVLDARADVLEVLVLDMDAVLEEDDLLGLELIEDPAYTEPFLGP